ncbi:hypothetical protein Bca101_082587 [Brassica carinata]
MVPGFLKIFEEEVGTAFRNSIQERLIRQIPRNKQENGEDDDTNDQFYEEYIDHDMGSDKDEDERYYDEEEDVEKEKEKTVKTDANYKKQVVVKITKVWKNKRRGEPLFRAIHMSRLDQARMTYTPWLSHCKANNKGGTLIVAIPFFAFAVNHRHSSDRYKPELKKLNQFVQFFDSDCKRRDEIGAGSTSHFLRYLRFHQGLRGPFLVLCPLSVTDGWVSEINRFNPILEVLRYVGDKDCCRDLRKVMYDHVNKSSKISASCISTLARSHVSPSPLPALSMLKNRRVKTNQWSDAVMAEKERLQFTCWVRRWGDVVEIKTWCQSVGRIATRGDWILKDIANGEVTGRATSKWVMMNQDTRRYTNFLLMFEHLMFCPKEPRLAFPGEENNRSLKKIPKLEDLAKYSIIGLKPRRADLEMNHHVNNVTYIRWLLESIPQEIVDTHEL